MGPMQERVLFARIGWMTYYSGSQAGDERPLGGGDYCSTDIGHEVCNFRDVGGKLFGYYQPNADTNLQRIDPTAPDGSSLDKVLVVFVARHRQRGQVIVGWYRNATVFREHRKNLQKGLKGYFYNILASTKDAVLLPDNKRKYPVPHGKNGMGRSNACYVYQANGNKKPCPWIRHAIRYVSEYAAANVLESPEEALQQEQADVAENHYTSQSGQGFKITPELRKLIEEHAVRRATKYFRGLHFEIQNVGNTQSYDLHCSRNGKELRVEVKGTQSAGRSIVLTPKEVSNAEKYPTALFVLHSIPVGRKGKHSYTVSGGEQTVLNPWRLTRCGTLKPICFNYRMN